MLRYAGFAVIATIANIGAQRFVLGLVPGTSGYIAAVICGTAVGLALKYFLDKRWIFYDQTHGLAAEGRTFSKYTLTGVFTTLIFWGTETGFWLVWQTDVMREAGAVLGLTVGYVIKYNLDLRYVFSPVAIDEAVR